jgi:septum formation protein
MTSRARTAALPLVLASGSPRRRELLSRLGLELEVAPADIDETPLPGEAPSPHALRIARAKAEAASARRPGAPVLAADTIVVLDGEILGKPRHRDQAREMLRRLSGRSHLVITAVAVRFAGREATVVEQARVTFRPVAEPLLDWYLATGEADDKAGAYAVQGRGALLVDRVEGNVQAVVGLPLAPLPDLFARVGLRLEPAGDRLLLSRRGGSARRAPTGGSSKRYGGR